MNRSSDISRWSDISAHELKRATQTDMTQLPDLFHPKTSEFEISLDRKQILINEVYGEETGGIFGFFTGTKSAKMAVVEHNETNYESS